MSSRVFVYKCVGAKANIGKRKNSTRNETNASHQMEIHHVDRRMCASSIVWNRVFYAVNEKKGRRKKHKNYYLHTYVYHIRIPSLGNAFCFRFHLNYSHLLFQRNGVVFNDDNAILSSSLLLSHYFLLVFSFVSLFVSRLAFDRSHWLVCNCTKFSIVHSCIDEEPYRILMHFILDSLNRCPAY